MKTFTIKLTKKQQFEIESKWETYGYRLGCMVAQPTHKVSGKNDGLLTIAILPPKAASRVRKAIHSK